MKTTIRTRASKNPVWRSLVSGAGILALSATSLASLPAQAAGQYPPNQQQHQPQQQQRQDQRQDQHRNQQQQQIQQNQRYDWRKYQPGRYPPQWQTYRRNFNPRPYQGNVVAPNRYRLQRYVGPHGWYYRRWVYGQYLPAIYWTRNYWLSSYWQFGLFNPPYGYVWVRYYDDALLISVENGHILRVVYGVFYY